jgi:hypothetical protein
VTEAWSSEPEDDDDLLSDEAADELDEPGDGAEISRSTPPGARLRSLASPLVVTLGAATLAFLGIRAVAGGGWQTLSAALQGPPPIGDAGASSRMAAPTPPVTPEPPAAEDLGMLAEQRKVPVDVTFTSELLDLPANTKLRPGHGLLEVHTWEPQRIYVDGVFMGNYESRLIPLNPGTYQLRLRDGGRDMERAVQVEAGRRTRLWARPKSSK